MGRTGQMLASVLHCRRMMPLLRWSGVIGPLRSWEVVTRMLPSRLTGGRAEE
jgi:hypothetical protein